jgi:hypothetical protein
VSCHCCAEISHSRPPIQHTGIRDYDVETPELLQRIGHHPLLSGGVADIDLVGEDLAALALDEIDRLG